MADEKCIVDPQRDCLGLHKANFLRAGACAVGEDARYPAAWDRQRGSAAGGGSGPAQRTAPVYRADAAPDAGRRLLSRVVPANMVIDLELRYNTHRMLRPRLHRMLRGTTHRALREEVLA
nr:hypothetical protein [Anaerotruncus colihominis]